MADGYKVGYNLATDCNSDGSALCAGGGGTALALAECVAASRISACNSNSTCIAHIPSATSCTIRDPLDIRKNCGATITGPKPSAAETATAAAAVVLVAAAAALGL